MKSKTIFTALFCITGFFFAQAQNQPDLSLLTQPEHPDPYNHAIVVAQVSGSIANAGNGQLAALQPRAVTMIVIAGATQGLSKIAVLIGSSAGSNDILYKEFVYGTQGDFGDGTSYHSVGNNITLVLGNYSGSPAYHAEVFGIMDDGKRSEGKRVIIQ